VVIYANRSYLQSIMSIIGLIGMLTGYFLGIIKCIKKRLANTVVILKAWPSIKGPKVVRNVSKVFYS
jgi:hypothetical protein